jgi:hypothetical protein
VSCGGYLADQRRSPRRFELCRELADRRADRRQGLLVGDLGTIFELAQLGVQLGDRWSAPPARAPARRLGWPKELADRCAARNFQPEWDDVRHDLDRLQEVEVEQDGKRFILRTPTTGCAGKLFQTLGVAPPPNIRDADLEATNTVAEPALL